jgi:hypothetical protein
MAGQNETADQKSDIRDEIGGPWTNFFIKLVLAYSFLNFAVKLAARDSQTLLPVNRFLAPDFLAPDFLAQNIPPIGKR